MLTDFFYSPGNDLLTKFLTDVLARDAVSLIKESLLLHIDLVAEAVS